MSLQMVGTDRRAVRNVGARTAARPAVTPYQLP
jgi:hypothetical protein